MLCIVLIFHRKFSSNVEKKKEDFNPIHQSEEEASCSTFVFDGIRIVSYDS